MKHNIVFVRKLSPNQDYSYPKSKNSSKSIAISALVHIHNAQTKGTQYKSMVKISVQREMTAPPGQIRSIVSFQCAQRGTFMIW